MSTSSREGRKVTAGREFGVSPTLADIAASSGVSPATVSRSLSGLGRISQETRQRVLKAADELGYRVNRHARSLRMQRSNVILVMIPDIANQNYAKLLLHIDRAAYAAGYEIMIAHTGVDTSRADRMADELFTGGVDGILLTSRYCPPRILACIVAGEALPVVRTLSPSDPQEGVFGVEIDEVAAARDTVEHLIEEGHRRIMHLGGPKDELVSRLREAGWRQALKVAGLGTGTVIARGFRVADGRRGARALLKRDRLPNAVFCANDAAAFGLITELREAGVKVPDDLAVAGFDDLEFSALFSPPLTTVHLPRHEMADAGIDTLVGMMEGKPAPAHAYIAHRLIVRDSSRGSRRDIGA